VEIIGKCGNEKMRKCGNEKMRKYENGGMKKGEIQIYCKYYEDK
jgi:hypothetical protein